MEANNAAPCATAIIGSIDISTFSVICSRIIFLTVSEKVGPPIINTVVKSVPVRLLFFNNFRDKSMAF